jgi:OmcA/MtrC family decaheme c-type cytochrome
MKELAMKSNSSNGFIRVGLVLLVLAGAVGLNSAGRRPYTKYQKAFYASDAVINFVRPGLVFKIVSAQIAQDGTITARVLVTDPQGLRLDRLGVDTPGAIRISFIAATISNGKKQYVAYTTRTAHSVSSSATAIQAGADSGGTFTTNADGDYTYTFKTKASGFDPTATHTIGVYGSRDLTAFNLGTNYASNTFNFVPNGSAVTTVRDVIRDSSCERCHDHLAFHGGSRVGISTCVLCHTPQTSDPNTGNTVDFPVMIHKIHYSTGLPSVRAGTPYGIYGFGGLTDFSSITFPADPGANAGKNFITGDPIVNGGVRHCEVCHDQNSGAAQAKAYLTNPDRAACSACHDSTNFATGENHVNLPQPDDNHCHMCHTPQGELEYDASIKGAHTLATDSKQLPGINFEVLKVHNGTAGNKPVITFTVKDNSGNPVAMSELAKTGRLAFVLAGPDSDYGYTKFGLDQKTGGYISENPTSSSSCGQDGTCSYTFQHAIPANATGTYSIGVEGRRVGTLNKGTTKEIDNVEYGGKNVVFNFSVDRSPLQSRRVIVDLSSKCNQCHVSLSVHGENRNQIEMCVLCHNPSETDSTTRALSKVPADKNAPPQGVNFTLLIHRIHSGDRQAAAGRPFTIVAFGGNKVDFSNVTFPVFDNTGSDGNGGLQKCFTCHVNDSQENLPVGLNNVTDPEGIIHPTSPATAAACMGCHNDTSTASHTVANTTAFGESCNVCHSSNADFAPNKVHAE